MKIFALLLLFPFLVRAEDRIVVEGSINENSARLFFDTGARYIYLFRPAAERFGLKLSRQKEETDDWNIYWAKKKYPVDLPGLSRKTRIAVLDLPSYIGSIEHDGLLGWGEVSDKIVSIDALNQ